MSVWIKQDVQGDLSNIMMKCHGRLVRYYKNKGKDFFVTSRREGIHSVGSLHYNGNAQDFKRQGISKQEIKSICGNGFDVIEYNDKDIFHVEYDPK